MSDAVTLDGLHAWVREFAALIAANKEQLTQLDAAIGDADHGTNMDRGMTAVLAALDGGEPPASAAALFKRVGMTLVSTVGGASGPLFGTFFIRLVRRRRRCCRDRAQGIRGRAAGRPGRGGGPRQGGGGRQDHV